MGISSNQSRLMTLTARQHDLELRAQQISAKKMITSMESQQMATEYSDALNKYSMMKSGEALHTDYLMIGAKGYNYHDYQQVEMSTQDYSEDYIENYFNKYGFKLIGKENLGDREYTEEEAADFLRKAQAEYDGATAKLSAEEKQLDMELTQINTEHNAVKTEYDSVKSLISDNTDKSFNIFS